MEPQVRDGLRWLEGIEDGAMNTGDLYILSQNLDPVLVTLIVKYLRKKYPASKPEGAGVTARLVDLSSTYPDLVKSMKTGESDPITEWFTETYNFGEFYAKPEEMVELIVEKIES